jgi:hypothetical protein
LQAALLLVKPAAEARSMIDADPIPLADGDLSDCAIVPLGDRKLGTQAVLRSRRRNHRRSCGRSMLSFTHELPGGRADHIACPIVDISTTGVAFEFDEAVEQGAGCGVAYRTIDGRPVHVNGLVRQCRYAGPGRYIVGVRFDRKLQPNEDKPAHSSLGREIAPGVRPRKLREPQ